MASYCAFVSDYTQNKIRVFFSYLGEMIFLFPYRFIAGGICLTIICSLGLLQLEEETRSLYLWIPQDSDVWNNHLSSIKHFGFYPERMNLMVQSNDDTLLTPQLMNTSFKVLNSIHDIQAKYAYNDICQRAFPSSPSCVSDTFNIFANPNYFDSNMNLWTNITSIMSVVNNPYGFPPIMSYLGDIQYTNNSYHISSATILALTYFLEGTLDNELYAEIYDFLYQFQTFWEKQHESFNSNITVYYYTTRSFDDEIARITMDDIPLFVAALFTMLIYLMITLGETFCQRPLLASSAILVLLCSLCMGFGLSSFIGTEFNTLVALTPYILLGVGVDDIIIIVDSFYNHRYNLSKALSHSGLSITITSLCSVMAFTIGSLVDVPAINGFCIFAAFSFASNYILQFLIFVPFLILDTRRKQKSAATEDEDSAVTQQKTESILDKLSCSHILSTTIIPCQSYRVFRWFIIIVFVVLNILSIYVLVEDYLDISADVSRLVPDDSFILKFFSVNVKSFPYGFPAEIEMVIVDKDFADKTVRNELFDMISLFQNDSEVSGNVDQWMPAFDHYLFTEYDTNMDAINSSYVFYTYLKQFTSSNDTNEKWKSEIVYDDDETPTYIKATRFKLNIFQPDDMNAMWIQRNRFVDMMNINMECDGCYVYSIEYPFGYFASIITDLTTTNMVYAAIGVFVVLFILMDLRMSLFVLMIIVMIDIDLFGWMYINNIALDTVSYVQLVMAVGLTVDYVLHMTQEIYITENNDLRVAFKNIGESVAKGAFTTFIGCLCLVFSASEAFRIFFKMFVGIIVIAISHGLLLTPAILSEFHCISSSEYCCAGRKDTDLQKQNSPFYQTFENGDTHQKEISMKKVKI